MAIVRVHSPSRPETARPGPTAHDGPLAICCTRARRRVLVSEAAYLDFSTTLLPGTRVLPAITGRARKQLLAASASAPVLPQIRTGLGAR